MHPDLSGLWPALLHPVSAGGALDRAGSVAHAKAMLAAGSDGVTLFGSTGEGPAFTVAQRNALLDALLDSGVRPDQILVTISAVALGDAISLGRYALSRGVQRQMLMPPFYFKQPRDAGIVQAVSEVVQGIGNDALRLVLYHFPAISTAGFSHAAIGELLRLHPLEIAGIKDSTGDLQHTLGLVKAFAQMSVLVGAEQHIAAVMQAGGAGSVCALANVAPHLLRRICSAPSQVTDADAALLNRLLALHHVQPDLNFVMVYRTLLAEQTGNPAWLRACAPLCPLEPAEDQAIRQGYRAIGAEQF